ncbi:hypothetical protein V8F06_004821 [Rhypophila decipiens]
MRPRLLSSQSLFLTLMVVLYHLPAAIAVAQCFGIDGQKSALAPCNSNATGSGNSHSACCDESKQEACLSSGLCYATQRGDNNTFWSQGCTDPMGRDPACPSYCGAASQFISMPMQPSYTMLFCGDAKWCCCFDNLGKTCDKTACCSRNFTLTQGLGTVVQQFNNAMIGPGGNENENESDTSCRSRAEGDCEGGDGRERGMRMIPFVVAGILGSLLLATVVAFGFSCTQNRRLRRQVESLQNMAANHKSSSFSSSSSSSTTISGRPSVHSIQPLVSFRSPSYQRDEPITPSPDSYRPGSGTGSGGSNSSTMHTTSNPVYNNQQYHSLGTAGISPHDQLPVTPSSAGPPPPPSGYGFPTPAHPPMPPQLSGRRPSLPDMQYNAPPLTPQQPVPMQVISELPTEKDQRWGL